MSTPAASSAPFGEPTPLGLFGLAIGCASLLPIAFGVASAFTPDALRLTGWFCLLFGGGCQFLAGMMSFANKNSLGGTLLTTFSFNWVLNWWSLTQLAEGHLPTPAVLLAVDCAFLAIFLVMTVAFGYFSKLLLVFLLDIDALYILRIAKELLHMPALALPIALATVALMLLALYIAFAMVLNPLAGRAVLPIAGPLFQPSPPQADPPSP